MIDPKEHEKRMESHREQHEKMQRWFWRIFYSAIAIMVLSVLAMIVAVVLLGMHFGEIVEFLEGFQPGMVA